MIPYDSVLRSPIRFLIEMKDWRRKRGQPFALRIQTASPTHGLRAICPILESRHDS